MQPLVAAQPFSFVIVYWRFVVAVDRLLVAII